VVIVAGVPQLGNIVIAIGARKWLGRVHYVYFITKKPYSDYLTQRPRESKKSQFAK